MIYDIVASLLGALLGFWISWRIGHLADVELSAWRRELDEWERDIDSRGNQRSNGA